VVFVKRQHSSVHTLKETKSNITIPQMHMASPSAPLTFLLRWDIILQEPYITGSLEGKSQLPCLGFQVQAAYFLSGITREPKQIVIFNLLIEFLLF
jgi:hypothetical protein